MGILKASSAALVLILAGCTTPRTVVPPLPLPNPPILPTIQAEALEKLDAAGEPCLDDATYEALVVRDAMRKAYADRLRAIIAAHNEKAAAAHE